MGCEPVAQWGPMGCEPWAVTGVCACRVAHLALMQHPAAHTLSTLRRVRRRAQQGDLGGRGLHSESASARPSTPLCRMDEGTAGANALHYQYPPSHKSSQVKPSQVKRPTMASH
jgi:hypothetical protein